MSSETDELVERYVAALAIFGERVADVADQEWDLPTPCPDWDVRQLVTHVVVGEAQARDVLEGRSGSTSESDTAAAMEVDAAIIGSHPMSVWRGTALAAISAAREADLDGAVFHHPSGELSASQLLGWRISENVIHAWDLAEAVGRPAALDEELAELSLAFWLPVALELAATGDYGEATEPPADASAGERLLHLVGRR